MTEMYAFRASQTSLSRPAGSAFGQRRHRIAEPVESGAKRGPPALVPAVVPTVAAAVGSPPLDSVGATPGRILDDLRFPFGWEQGQKLAVIDQLRQLFVFDVAQGIGQRHFSVAMMMAIALAVGGHMDHLRRGVAGINATSQPPGKILAVIENSFEGDGTRNWAVVEKDGNASPLLQPNQVGVVRMDGGIGSLNPASDSPV